MGQATENQYKAIAHFEDEAKRYARMSVRCKDIGLYLMSSQCQEISRLLKDGAEMQSRILLRNDMILPDNWRQDKKKETIE